MIESSAFCEHYTDETLDRRPALKFLSGMGPLLYAARLTSGTIKIGFTTDLYERIRVLRSVVRTHHAEDAELVAFRFGSRADEQKIHHSLAEHARWGREYYHPAPAVVALVDEWRAALGRPPL